MSHPWKVEFTLAIIGHPFGAMHGAILTICHLRKCHLNTAMLLVFGSSDLFRMSDTAPVILEEVGHRLFKRMHEVSAP